MRGNEKPRALVVSRVSTTLLVSGAAGVPPVELAHRKQKTPQPLVGSE